MKTEQQGIICGGDMFLALFDDSGVRGNFSINGNAKKCALKVETETKENKLNGRDTLGQTADSFTRITSATIALEFNRYDPDLLALANMGTAVDDTADAGSYETTITGAYNLWVPIGSRNLGTAVVQNEAKDTNYVAGTDYEVNLRLGLIKVIKESIAGTLAVSGTTLARTGKIVRGSTRSLINAALMLDGKNYANGNDVAIEIFQAQLRSTTEFDALAEDFPTLTFEGTLVTPSGKTWPYEIR